MKKNAYVQLVVKGNATYAVFYPPVEGGNRLLLKDVLSYFDHNLLDGYNKKLVSEACDNATETVELQVGNAPSRPFNETMYYDVSLDKMKAVCWFYPASSGGSICDEREIVTTLQHNGIKYGIDINAVRDLLRHKEYNTEYVVAVGKPAKQGTDASIEYFFNTSLNTKPKKNEDGSVNYYELNTVSEVKKDQLLAKLTPAVQGEAGTDVYGNFIKPRNVRDLHLEFGNNISVNDDRTELYSNVTGHATLVKNQVFVSDVLEIPADVDTSTGNITYDGSVLIHGNVKSGFKIAAKGDVIVDGVVEGAMIKSDGQIIIKRGIHGMSKGVLDAAGNVICKFIESSTVICGGYVETDGIMHSKVSAATEIHVAGKKGIIAGGMIRAGNLIETETLGSEMGAATTIEVGNDPSKKNRYLQLQDIIKEKKKELDTIKPILATFSEKMSKGLQLPADKIAYVQKMAAAYKEGQQAMIPLQDEFNMLHQEISASSSARVKVNKVVYPGVTIIISEVGYTTKDKRQYCQFVKEAGDVVCKNL